MPAIARTVSKIRTFNVELDSTWLHRLWHKTMHARWSLSLRTMQRVLASARFLLVVESDGDRIGFCACDYKQRDASLLVLLVEPLHQRQGFGSALLQQLEALLIAEQVNVLHLGAISNGTYFWPGMPAENDVAWPFFLKHAWKEEEVCADLVQELASFRTPASVASRFRQTKIVLRLVDPDLGPRVAEFEWAAFPAWAPFIENALAQSGDQNLLIAQTEDGLIVGTILMEVRPNLWVCDSQARIGSLNILGIAPAIQRQGVGLALTARAMEILQARGCSRCYIQWTGLADWYGKLGTRVWAEYRTGSKALFCREAPLAHPQ